MNREIIFRGKKNGKWIYGYYIQNPNASENRRHCILKTHAATVSGVSYHAVDPETIGQLISVQNGCRIFEGDIVSVHQFLFDGNEIEKEWIGYIEWVSDEELNGPLIAGFGIVFIEGDFFFEDTSYEKGKPHPPMPLSHIYGLHEESFKVIGNIHDNPELLTPSA